MSSSPTRPTSPPYRPTSPPAYPNSHVLSGSASPSPVSSPTSPPSLYSSSSSTNANTQNIVTNIPSPPSATTLDHPQSTDLFRSLLYHLDPVSQQWIPTTPGWSCIEAESQRDAKSCFIVIKRDQNEESMKQDEMKIENEESVKQEAEVKDLSKNGDNQNHVNENESNAKQKEVTENNANEKETDQNQEPEESIPLEQEMQQSPNLLRTRITTSIIYQRQEPTLILWSDEGTSKDYALSFETREQCDIFWNVICHVQSTMISQEERERLDQLTLPNGDVIPLFPLPAPEIENLALMERIMVAASSIPQAKNTILDQFLEQDQLLWQWTKLAQWSLDLESKQELNHFFQIMKFYLLLNRVELIERLLQAESFSHFITFCTLLEFDPEFPSEKRAHFAYLSENHFQDLVPFEHQELKQSIHALFKLLYLKDVVCIRWLDDETMGTLIQMQRQKTEWILDALTDEETASPLLMSCIRRHEKGLDFLLELLSLMKQMARTALCSHMIGHWQLISYLVEHLKDAKAMECFILLVEMNGVKVREWLLKHDDCMQRLMTVTEQDLERKDENVNIHHFDCSALSLLRRLLLDTNDASFLSYFYDRFVHLLFKPLLNPQACIQDESLLELLNYFLVIHGYRIKYWLLGSGLFPCLIQKCRSTHRFTCLAIIRLVKTLISLKDSFYDRFLMKSMILNEIMKVYEKESNRDNLVTSAIYDLFMTSLSSSLLCSYLMGLIPRSNVHSNSQSSNHRIEEWIWKKLEEKASLALNTDLDDDQVKEEQDDSTKPVEDQPPAKLFSPPVRKLVDYDDEADFLKTSTNHPSTTVQLPPPVIKIGQIGSRLWTEETENAMKKQKTL